MRFGTEDIVVFCLIPCLPVLQTIIAGFMKQVPGNFERYLVGDRKLGVFPCTLSLIANFQSAIFITGVVYETYKSKYSYFWLAVGYLPGALITGELIIPHFFKKDLINGFQIFTNRFHSERIELVCSIIYIIQTTAYLSVVMFVPANFLTLISEWALWKSILVISAICIVYTAIGGIKVVILTDMVQMGFISIAIGVILVLLVLQVDKPFSTILSDAAKENDLDPFVIIKHLVLSILLTSSIYGTNQTMIQRYISLGTQRRAKMALYLHLIGNWTFFVICGFIGITAREIVTEEMLAEQNLGKRDILFYVVINVLSKYKGLGGLFIGTLFAAAISTLSSGLNSVTSVTYKPFFRLLKKKWSHEVLERRSIHILRLICCVFGVIVTALSLTPMLRTTQALKISFIILGSCGTPVLCCFLTTLYIKPLSEMNILFGLICGSIVAFWIVIDQSVLLTNGVFSDVDYFYLSSLTLISSISATILYFCCFAIKKYYNNYYEKTRNVQTSTF